MEFMKKQSAGFYFSAITIVLLIVGAVLYLGNCKTAYFGNLGVNKTVIISLIIAIMLEIAFVIANEVVGSKIVLDVLPVVSAVLITIATVVFISTRVNGMAAIMTFTNNAATMLDFNNTIVTIAFCALAMIFSMIASFFNVVKE